MLEQLNDIMTRKGDAFRAKAYEKAKPFLGFIKEDSLSLSITKPLPKLFIQVIVFTLELLIIAFYRAYKRIYEGTG